MPRSSSATRRCASNPRRCPTTVLDLGTEWTQMTGLPMVFAVWAGTPRHDPEPFAASLRFGREHLDEIVAGEYANRGITADLARDYLTKNVTFDLGAANAKASNCSCSMQKSKPGGRYYYDARRSDRPVSQRRPDRHRHGRRRGPPQAAPAKASSATSSTAISTTPTSAPNIAASAPSTGRMGHAEGYVHPKEVIFDKIQETLDLGGTGILMQGGLHPDLKIEWYEDLLRVDQEALRHLVPLLLRAGDRQHRRSQRASAFATRIARLRDAGLDSIPGGGAEILDDDVRHRISRLKCSVQDWIDVHRTCPRAGHAHHRDDDVRHRRDHRTAHEPLRHRAPDPGRDRRLHRVHPVELSSARTPRSAGL